MRKGILLFTCTVLLIAAMVMGNEAGVARVSQLNRTGSDSGPVGCDGSGCHNAGTYNNDSLPPSLLITDVNNNPVTSFMPANVYIIHIKGTSTAPKWGFQISCNHTMGGMPYPAGFFLDDPPTSHDTFINDFTIVEQNHILDVVNDTMYAKVYWTAPIASAVDSANFFFSILNSNGDGTEDGDNSNSYSLTLSHWTTLVPALNAELVVNTYPNPFTDKLNISIEHADYAQYNIRAFDMQGKVLYNQSAMINQRHSVSLDASSWAPGIYYVQLSKATAKKLIKVIKQ